MQKAPDQKSDLFHVQVTLKDDQLQLLDENAADIDTCIVIGPEPFAFAGGLYLRCISLAYATTSWNTCTDVYNTRVQISFHDSEPDEDEGTPLIAMAPMFSYVVWMPRECAVSLMRLIQANMPAGHF